MEEQNIFGMFREKQKQERKNEKYEKAKEWTKEKYEKTKQVLKRTTKRRKLKTAPHTHAFGGMLYRHW